MGSAKLTTNRKHVVTIDSHLLLTGYPHASETVSTKKTKCIIPYGFNPHWRTAGRSGYASSAVSSEGNDSLVNPYAGMVGNGETDVVEANDVHHSTASATKVHVYLFFD